MYLEWVHEDIGKQAINMTETSERRGKATRYFCIVGTVIR